MREGERATERREGGREEEIDSEKERARAAWNIMFL